MEKNPSSESTCGSTLTPQCPCVAVPRPLATLGPLWGSFRVTVYVLPLVLAMRLVLEVQRWLGLIPEENRTCKRFSQNSFFVSSQLWPHGHLGTE